MNTRMYRNPIVQDNMKILQEYGMEVITPATGYLACGDTGEGKMPDPELLMEYILRALQPKDLFYCNYCYYFTHNTIALF